MILLIPQETLNTLKQMELQNMLCMHSENSSK